MGSMLRRGALIVAAVLLVLIARGMLEGRAAIVRARACDKDVECRIAYAMRATKWYVPFASHPAEGYELLRNIARQAESVGDVETALIAWQAIRGGARATRSFYQPFEDRAREADAQIAILLAARPPPGIDKDKPREKIVLEHRQDLARTEGPNPVATVALYAGLALAIFGAYRAMETTGPDAETDRRRRMTSLAIGAVGLLTLVLAFARA